MGRKEDINVRPAVPADIPFLIETIIQAEKSGTGQCALLELWSCDESQLREYLRNILEEEIEGTEWSIQSFFVAEKSGQVIGAFAGWIEGRNEWDLSSSTLKANLMKACLPIEVIIGMSSFQEEIQAISIPRTKGTLQLEYAYVLPEFQGQGVIQMIIEAIMNRSLTEVTEGVGAEAEVQVFANNQPAIRAYSKLGFVCTFETIGNAKAAAIFPCDVKYKMTRK
jgi:ribosomal protein S18 acetylase RimI-like enzyme